MKYQKQKLHSWQHVCVQRRVIPNRIDTRRANTLQAHRDIPVHEFSFVSPSRRKKRRSIKGDAFRILKTNFSENTFEGNIKNFGMNVPKNVTEENRTGKPYSKQPYHLISLSNVGGLE